MSSVAGLINLYDNIRMFVDYVKTGEVKQLPPDIRTQGRITRVLTQYMVRPMVIISKDLEYMDQNDLKAVIDTELKIFLSVYMNAIKIMVTVEGLNVTDVFARTNRTSFDKNSLLRRVRDVVPIGESVGVESLLNGDNQIDLLNSMAGMEDDSNDTNNRVNKNKRTISADEKTFKLENQFIQTFDITLDIKQTKDEEEIDRTLTVPLVVYPVIVFTDVKEVFEELVEPNREASFKERFFLWKAGAISLSDLLFATDLIKKYKEKRIKNNNDVVKTIRKIVNTTDINDLIRHTISFSKRFNIYIISTEDKLVADRLVGGNIFIDKYKEKILDLTYAFSIAVVDADKERVYRIIDGIPKFSVTLFKAMRKQKDIDVNEIFKNMLMNKSPF